MSGPYDVVIIGGGPAGVSAAIYAMRKLLRTALISRDIGGQVLLTGNIENYPGYLGRSGSQLADCYEQQLKELNPEMVTDVVKAVEKQGGLFCVRCEEGEYYGRTVIATGGSCFKKLNVPGEAEFLGRGVSCCATCDAPITRNKVVAVIGGGNAAFQSAELLCKFASKVYLIHRRREFRADGILVERVKRLPNIEFLLGTMILEIKGTRKVEGIVIREAFSASSSPRALDVQKVFVEIGREINVEYIKHLVRTNEHGQVIVDREQKTCCEGLFAAGDITDLKYGQAIIAAGQGAVAALSAYDYLMAQ